MTRDDVIRMAQEAGVWIAMGDRKKIEENGLERFAALVAAHKTEVAIAEAYRCGHEAGVVEEREACAQVCNEHEELAQHTPLDCAISIRARSNP